MLKRIATALVLLALVLGTIFGLRIFSPIYVDIMALLFLALGAYEITVSLKKAGYNPMIVPIALVVTLVFPAMYFFPAIKSTFEIGLACVLALGVLTALSMFTFSSKRTLQDLFATLFVMLYPVALFSFFFILNNKYGLLAILLVLFVPILTDTMAYFTGMTFKGPKLCPTISPKKTVSGAIGGLIGGVMGAVIVFLLFDYFNVFASFANVGQTFLVEDRGVSAAIYVAVGLMGAALCEAGDLAASRIKRCAGIKDYGKIFPGHGGIMDRMDSIIFMVPTVYLLFCFLNTAW